MKLISLLMVLALPCLLLAQNTAVHPLEGTWKMTTAKWGKMKEHKQTKRDIYKIFTKDKYFFIYYNDQKFSGAGGGDYTVEGNTFKSTNAYYSWDSTAVGKTQTFNWVIEGNTLHQFGLIKGADKYDNYVIDEYYERVEDGIGQNEHPLVGVWQVEEATYGNETTSAANSRWQVNKIFTDKFWYITYFDPKTGGFNGAGFGTYALKDNEYHETIEAFSWDQTAVGQTNTFSMKIEPETLVQKGEINTDEYQNYTIIERFKRIE
ncbi:MAG: hypothetical protein AAF849_04295 [Bacteroidota bacterium]